MPVSTAHLLPETTSLYQLLAANLPGGALFVVAHDLRYLLAEGEALTAMGLSAARFVGRTIAEVNPPEFIPDYESDYRQALAGRPFAREHEVAGRTFLSRGSPLRNPAGEIVGALAISIDISDRKRMEVALRESEQRLLQFGRAASAVIWTRDAATLQFEYVSPAFEKIYGRALGEILPGDNLQNWAALLHPEDRERAVASIERVRHGEMVTFEHRVRRPDGTIRWLRDVDFPIRDASGRVVRIGGIGEDVTALKDAQEALQRADRRKDEFLATLAHELRNPLAPLRNGIELARLAGRDDPVLGRVLEMMDRQLRHLVRLVDDLLDVGRISAGKIQLEFAPVDLAQVLRRSLESVQSLLDRHRHRLTLDLPEQAIEVDADLDRLTQVFTNLLSNAAKYTPPGGRIRLSLEATADEARVRVEDDGIGIPADDLRNVFELFSQVRAHQGQTQGGLGIGLALVHRLVTMHGGSVEADSAGPGRGSRFTVRVPRLRRPTLPQAAPAPATPPLSRLRILVVDDNLDAAASLAELLCLQGQDCSTAHDGFAALELVRRIQPQLVILDLGMPGMDGIETAHRIRELPDIALPRLAALTGWGQDRDRARTRDAHFDWHLVKPVDQDRLLEVLIACAALQGVG